MATRKPHMPGKGKQGKPASNRKTYGITPKKSEPDDLPGHAQGARVKRLKGVRI